MEEEEVEVKAPLGASSTTHEEALRSWSFLSFTFSAPPGEDEMSLLAVVHNLSATSSTWNSHCRCGGGSHGCRSRSRWPVWKPYTKITLHVFETQTLLLRNL